MYAMMYAMSKIKWKLVRFSPRSHAALLGAARKMGKAMHLAAAQLVDDWKRSRLGSESGQEGKR